MKFKELLTSIKDNLLTLKDEKNTTEISLENHAVADKNIYRLEYIKYFHNKEYMLDDSDAILINRRFKPFTLPEYFTPEEAFKVLSYLADFIAKEKGINNNSSGGVKTLDAALDLERFGFSRVEESNDEEIISLFTVAGNIELFKESPFYPNYFSWYKPEVTRSEIEGIYAKHNKTFKDIVWIENKYGKELKLFTCGL